jgi:Na+/H+ antiporter NhaD/arsenite permease-like protein
MDILLISVFVIGYAAIAFEHQIKINKTASALVIGVLLWTFYITSDHGLHDHEVNEQLLHHVSEIASILFFLMGAMTIVELVDAHNGFYAVTSRITTTNKVSLLWVVGWVTFFMSAALDNLTTAIVMVSLLRKIIKDREDRMFFAGIVVIAANAGGAWSPIGDVTTTMLWIGGQITTSGIIVATFLPSVVCLLIPLIVLSFTMKGNIERPAIVESESEIPPLHRNLIFGFGLGGLLFVPIFKTFTHLPPFMGVLLVLGILWIVTEILHGDMDEAEAEKFSVTHAIRKTDMASVLFFLGILVAIGALQSTGILKQAATALDNTIGNLDVIVVVIGALSAIVDNVPLVAGAMGMYSMEQFPTDAKLWEFMAYCAGTGGSMLIIGSAAGVAVMGMEKIDFVWYIKKITFLAAIGYLAGAAVYLVQYSILH